MKKEVIQGTEDLEDNYSKEGGLEDHKEKYEERNPNETVMAARKRYLARNGEVGINIDLLHARIKNLIDSPCIS